MGRFLQRIKSAAIALGCALLAGGSVQQASAQKAEFIYIDRGEVSTLDPQRLSWLQDIRLAYGIFEGLYVYDPATLKPIPGAARSVDISPDKKTYTFHIREDAKWSNGDPVTADNFQFSWRRMLQTPGDYTYLYYYIVGAEQYEKDFAANPKSADFSKVGIKVIDPRTIQVTLRNPTPFFLELIAFAPYFPLNEKSMEKFKQVDDNGVATYDGAWIRPPNLVGNGPYRLDSWEPKVGQLLVLNEFYWDKANVKSRTIRALSLSDPTLAFQMYDRGDVDWMSDVPGDIASRMRDAGRPDIHIFPSFGTYFYTINCSDKLPGNRENPFKDIRVRQALAMAIDKQPIVDNITKLDEQPTDVYVPPVFDGYPTVTGLAFDVDRARQLLAEAGYPGGKNFPSMKLCFNPEYNTHKLVAEYVRNQWQQNLGITFELDSAEIVQFRERLNKKDYDVARASWYGDYMDVSTFTDKYVSTSLNNDANWINPKYDELLKQAEEEPDAQKRLEMLAQAEQILLDESPIIPLYHYVNCFAHRDNVFGISQHPKLMVMLKAVGTDRSTGGK